MGNDFNLTEKVSVNINSSTLSQIDLLVDNGYYSNRSDFINQALRENLKANEANLNRIIDGKLEKNSSENHWFCGLCVFDKKDIDEMFEKGEKTSITGYGVFVIDDNADPEKVFAVFKNIDVHGKVKALLEVKAHYGIK